MQKSATDKEIEDYINYQSALEVLSNREDVEEYDRLRGILTTPRRDYRELADKIENARAIKERIEKEYGYEPFAHSKLRIEHQIKMNNTEKDRIEESIRERESTAYAEAERQRRERIITTAPSTIRSLLEESRRNMAILTEKVTQSEAEYNSIIGDTKPELITSLIVRIREEKTRADTAFTQLVSQQALADNRTTAIKAVEDASIAKYTIQPTVETITRLLNILKREKNTYEESIARPIISELEIKKQKWIKANARFLATFENNTAYNRSWVLPYSEKQRSAKNVLDTAEREYTEYHNTNKTKLREQDKAIYGLSAVTAEIAKITKEADCAALYTARKALEEGVGRDLETTRARSHSTIDELKATILKLESDNSQMNTRLTEIDSELGVKGIIASKRFSLTDDKRKIQQDITRNTTLITTKKTELSRLEKTLQEELEVLTKRLEGGNYDGKNDEEYWKQKYLKYKAKYLKLKTNL
jgi:hypothetical protein